MNGRKEARGKNEPQESFEFMGQQNLLLEGGKKLLGLTYVTPNLGPFHISHSLHSKKAFNCLIAKV